MLTDVSSKSITISLFYHYILQKSDNWCELLPTGPLVLFVHVGRLVSCFISQVVRSRRSRRQLLPEVNGVLRSAHQQVEHVYSHGQEARRSRCGDVQQLPVCCRGPRRPGFQPLLQTLRLCWKVLALENTHTHKHKESSITSFGLQLDSSVMGLEWGR